MTDGHITEPVAKWRPWLMWALGASTFGYAFFHRVAPSVMVSDLMRDFTVGAAVLGNLSALYFYAYAGLQIPIGVLIDRWGPRAMLTGALLVASLGSLMFALAAGIEMAYAGRLLVGIGSAVGFVATLTLVSRWFPSRRFAFLAGLTMLVGMAAGVGAQAPLSTVVMWIGWRPTLLAAAVFGLVLAIVIWLFVRNQPPAVATARTAAPVAPSSLSQNLKLVLGNIRVWNIALVSMSLSAPLLAFGGLWGVPYMMMRYDLSGPEAAFTASLMLIGWAAGAPSSGWLSDYIGRRKLPLLVATTINTSLLLILFYAPGLPLLAAMALIFLIGMSGASMVVAYAFAREYTPGQAEGAVTGFVNGMTVAAGAVFQPIIGLMLDLRWSGTIVNGAPVYSVATYNFAFSSLVIAAALGTLGALIPRETYCRSVAPSMTPP